MNDFPKMFKDTMNAALDLDLVVSFMLEVTFQ